MDILQTYLSPQGTTVPPPCGPRTQGGSDAVAHEDLRIYDSLPVMRIAHLDTPTLNVRPLTKHVITMATYNDRHVLVHTDNVVHDFVNNWITNIKCDFQHMRLTNKRTWPEFLDAIYSGQFIQDDCEILQFLRATPVYTDGNYPRDIGDLPLETSIIKDGEIKTVLDCCELKDYDTTDRDSLVSAGRALLLDIRSSDAVLVSKIVTRAQHISRLKEGAL
jgi:hypothetical protein